MKKIDATICRSLKGLQDKLQEKKTG